MRCFSPYSISSVLALFVAFGSADAFAPIGARPLTAPAARPPAATAASAWSVDVDPLDDSSVLADETITAARKCGFCMGESHAPQMYASCGLHLRFVRLPSLFGYCRLSRTD